MGKDGCKYRTKDLLLTLNISDIIDLTSQPSKTEVINMNYTVFTLGYDLLQETLSNEPCDSAYDICVSLALEFISSDENKDMDMSGYDALQKWISDNNIEQRVRDMVK